MVERQSFTADVETNSDGPCSAQRRVKITLDFEGPSIDGVPAGFGLMDISAASCATAPNEATGCQASLHFIRAD